MGNVSNLRHLSFDECDDSRLRIINGSTLVVKGSSSGNQPPLRLIWGKSVSEGSRKKSKQTNQTSGHEDPGMGLLAWFNTTQGLLTAIGLVVAACFFFGSWYMKSGLKEELREYVDTSLKEGIAPIREEVRKTREDIIKLQAGLANIQGRLGSLLGVVYKEEIAALGIKDPQIIPVQVSAPFVTSPSDIDVKVSGTFSDGTTMEFYLTVAEVTRDSITFVFNGVLRGSVFHGIEVTLSREVGVPVELNKVLPIPDTPKILLTILDYPTKNTAIVAVGEKSTS